jgi:hypothetical protein
MGRRARTWRSVVRDPTFDKARPCAVQSGPRGLWGLPLGGGRQAITCVIDLPADIHVASEVHRRPLRSERPYTRATPHAIVAAITVPVTSRRAIGCQPSPMRILTA